MKMEDFQKMFNELVPKDDDGWLFTKKLEMWVHEDGCLGATYDNESIPCEDRPWDEALNIIIQFIQSLGETANE